MKILTILFAIFGIVYSQNQCVTPNGERAQCISIYKCRVFVNALKNRTPELIQFMRASRCGYSEDPLVCCGSVANYQQVATPEPITQKPVTNKDLLSHRNINMLAPLDDCGHQSLGDRIVNGNLTEIDEYPWTVLLEYKNRASGRSVGHACGGILIGPKYILTAAHCVVGAITRELGDLYRVRLGEYDQTTSPIDCVDVIDYDTKQPTGAKDCNKPFQDIDVVEAVAHPGYIDGHPNRYHDIAIARLARPVEYNDFVKPICMPLRGESKAPGQYLDVAGWGVTETGRGSPVKLKATIPVVANNECARVYSSKYGVQIHDKQLCAGGEGNVDSCNGDSGGPLMTTFPKKAEYYVEGLVSFGARACGTPGVPGVYTRVASYNEWILDNMKQ